MRYPRPIIAFLLGLLTGWASQSALADAANNFVLNKTAFGNNDQVIIELGVLTIDQSDNIVPASNVFIVPSGTLTPGAFLPALDPSGVANVIQGAGGGGFFDETIGFTQPAGSLYGGSWDIVEDANQNNIFDGPADSVLVNAFTVTLNADAPNIMTSAEIAAIKLRAANARAEWRAAADLFDLAFQIADWAEAGVTGGIDGILELLRARIEEALFPIPSLRDVLESAGIPIPETSLMDFTIEVGKDLMDDASQHYAGIAADPPDPNFRQITPLRFQPKFLVPSNDPVDRAAGELANALAVETALADAFLDTLERYQGADADNNGDWALLHARTLAQYADLLATQLAIGDGALASMISAITADGTDLDTAAANLQALIQPVQMSGLDANQVQALANLGQSPAEIAAFESYVSGLDFSGFGKAAWLASLSGLRATNAGQRGEFANFATFMQGVVATLEADPIVVDFAPVAEAGGPYAGTAGNSITLDGSGSTTASGSLTSFAWDLDGDGAFDDATGVNPVVNIPGTGDFLVGLRVNNSLGHTAVDYAPVRVNSGNTPPVIDNFLPPDLYPRLSTGVAQAFSIDASDADGDTLTIEWTLDGNRVGSGAAHTYTPTVAETGIHRLDAVVRDGNASNGLVVHSWSLIVAQPDADGDGYTIVGGDCDDSSAAINPGAAEVIGNGLDDDCDPGTADADQPPVAGFFTDPAIGVLGQPVQLRDTSTDPNGVANIVQWDWDFGDGGVSTAQHPLHSFGAGGPFTIQLTVTDAQGNTDSSSQTFEALGEAFIARISEPNIDDRATLGDEGDDDSGLGASGYDGPWVAFASRATNLVPGDTNGEADVFVANRDTGQVVRVSVHTDGTQAQGGPSQYPVISPDGRYVLFHSWARNLTGVDTDGDGRCDPVPDSSLGWDPQCTPFTAELYLRDRDTDDDGIFDEPGAVSTTMVIPYYRITADAGFPVISAEGAMSDDARFIVFQSISADLVPGVGPEGTTAITHVFMLDRNSGEIRNVSRDIAGNALAGAFTRSLTSYGRRISADGRYLLWFTARKNVVGEDTDGDGLCDRGCSAPGNNYELYLYDWQTDSNRQVSINSKGEVAAYNTTNPTYSQRGSMKSSISADGRFVAFLSEANNLYLDANGDPLDMSGADDRNPDVYVHDRDADGDGVFDEPGGIATRIVSLDPNGLANAQSGNSAVSGFGATTQSVHISDDGRQVLFRGKPKFLVPGMDTVAGTVGTPLLHDRLSGKTSVAFTALDGSPATSSTARRHYLRGSGRLLIYQTANANLIGNDRDGDGICRESRGDSGCDTNGVYDVFVLDRDPDEDGVLGGDDRCPNDPPGTEVDSDGCPLPAGIAISKTPATQQLRVGDAAAFTITVTNTGLATLQDVAVSDPLAPACDRLIGVMPPDTRVSYDCTLADVRVDFTNIATVSGTSNAGESVRVAATADVDVIHPGIEVSILPDVQTVVAGQDFLFTVEGRNPGDVALNGVVVSDPLVPGCNRELGRLAPGQEFGYACLADAVSVGFTNRIDIRGVPPVGGEVNASASAVVQVREPDLIPPVLNLPPSVVLDATSAAGTIHTYIVTAIDAVDPNPRVTCDPPSGSLFPVGVTRVDCIATDASGNSSSGSFTVTVNPFVVPVPPVESLSVRAKSGKIDLVWEAVAVPAYNIYRSDAGMALQRIATTASRYAVYADFGLVNGTEYCYVVRSVDADGNESIASPRVCATPRSLRGP